MSAPALHGALEIAGTGAKTAEITATRIVPAVITADLVQRLIVKTALVRLPVRGESMRPTVRSGDHVTLAPSTRPPARGDLVALRTADGLAVRRYVGRSSEGLIATAGDNDDGFETPVPETALAGFVVAVERRGCRVGPGSTTGAGLRRTTVALARRCRATARELLRRMAG